MGLIRKSLYLETSGLVSPNSKKQRQQKQILAAMQGATPAEVRRAGGRYDFNGFWGQPPASVTRGSAARQAPSKPEGQARSDAAAVGQPPAERLAEVSRLHDAGLLTDEEYQAKRAKMIDEL